MYIKLSIYLVLFFVCSPVFGQINSQYIEAFEKYIRPSEEFEKLAVHLDVDDYSISKKIREFDYYGVFMENILKKIKRNNGKYGSVDSPLTKGKYGKKRSNRKVFFTKAKNGYFLAEAFYDLIKKPDIRSSEVYGLSYLFLFSITEDNELELVTKKELHNN